MTNLQKASQLVSDILKLKLGQGDIIQYEKSDKIGVYSKPKVKVLYYAKVGEDKHSILTIDGWLNQYIKFKLIQRNITIPMVLEAMNMKEFNYLIEGIESTQDDNIIIAYDILDSEGVQHFGDVTWILRKNGKDCNLSDQSEELCKFVVEVLK